MNIRVGFGFDVHELQESQNCILGGINIPHNKGTVGHSDADVLIHAICDALLGAANLGDIGQHFPNTSPEFKDISSSILLKKVLKLISDKGFKLGNIDSTVCLEKPKLAPYINEMKSTLAHILATDPENISIKATTSEKLGFTGREEGIAAYAVALLFI